MFNEFNVNLCEYCPRCRYGKLDKNGKRTFYCKYAEPHSYEIPKCAHYMWHWRWSVPRIPFWKKLWQSFKHLLYCIFCLPFKKFFSLFARKKKDKKRLPKSKTD